MGNPNAANFLQQQVPGYPGFPIPMGHMGQYYREPYARIEQAITSLTNRGIDYHSFPGMPSQSYLPATHFQSHLSGIGSVQPEAQAFPMSYPYHASSYPDYNSKYPDYTPK